MFFQSEQVLIFFITEHFVDLDGGMFSFHAYRINLASDEVFLELFLRALRDEDVGVIVFIDPFESRCEIYIVTHDGVIAIELASNASYSRDSCIDTEF